MNVHKWQKLRSCWMAKPGMEMTLRKWLEKKPRGGQLLGEVAVSGQLNSLPGEAGPTDRKHQPSTRSTEGTVTVASSTE